MIEIEEIKKLDEQISSLKEKRNILKNKHLKELYKDYYNLKHKFFKYKDEFEDLIYVYDVLVDNASNIITIRCVSISSELVSYWDGSSFIWYTDRDIQLSSLNTDPLFNFEEITEEEFKKGYEEMRDAADKHFKETILPYMKNW